MAWGRNARIKEMQEEIASLSNRVFELERGAFINSDNPPETIWFTQELYYGASKTCCVSLSDAILALKAYLGIRFEKQYVDKVIAVKKEVKDGN